VLKLDQPPIPPFAPPTVVEPPAMVPVTDLGISQTSCSLWPHTLYSF